MALRSSGAWLASCCIQQDVLRSENRGLGELCMRKSMLRVTFICLAGVFTLAGTAAVAPRLLHRRAANANSSSQGKQENAGKYGQMPLAFERNAGQAASAVEFVARGNGYALLLERTGI